MIRRAAYINHGFDLVVFESVLPGRSGRLFFSSQCESELSRQRNRPAFPERSISFLRGRLLSAAFSSSHPLDQGPSSTRNTSLYSPHHLVHTDTMHLPRIGFGMSLFISTSPVNDFNHIPSVLVDLSPIAGPDASESIPYPIA